MSKSIEGRIAAAEKLVGECSGCAARVAIYVSSKLNVARLTNCHRCGRAPSVIVVHDPYAEDEANRE